MAAFLDGCRFIPTLGGTTDWTYASAVGGYNSPALAGVVNGTLYKYRAESADLTQWEMGEGAYNTSTGVLARTTVLFNSSGTGTAAGQSGAGTKISFSTVPQVAIVALKEDLAKAPSSWTRTVFTSGSGTYTTHAACTAILIRMIGGGGGSGGSGSGATDGGSGTATTFNAGAITAPAGSPSLAGNAQGGAAGVAGIGGDFSIPGGVGQNGDASIALGDAGCGGNSAFGGGGRGARPSSVADNTAGSANSGGGGGGAGSGTSVGSVGGGGAGAYTEKLITAPASSYTYVVGAGGAAGGTGSAPGVAGAAGAAGIIIIDEYY